MTSVPSEGLERGGCGVCLPWPGSLLPPLPLFRATWGTTNSLPAPSLGLAPFAR